MKKGLLALFIFFGFIANAQIFSPAGAEWNYRLNNPWTNSKSQVTYTYVGDTLINGITAQKIVRSNFASYYLPAYYFHSTADAIFCYSFAAQAFTKLFDFNLNVGDSLFINNIDATCAADTSGSYHKITAKGTDVINGISYRWVNYEFMYGNGFAEYLIGKYYEKLGRENGFFAPELGCVADADYIDCARRYWDNTDTVDHTANCLLAGINDNPAEKFSLYPNPINNGTLTIQSQNTVKHIQFIDMLGQSVLSTMVANNTVNIGSVAPGIYVAKVIFTNGKTGIKKVIISN